MFDLFLTRSYLFTPAHKPELFHKSVQSGADVLIIDLEDSLPVSYKNNIHTTLSENLDLSLIPRFGYRINSIATPYGLRDILFIRESKIKPEMIVLPIVETLEEIKIIRKLLPDIKLISTIESPKGICYANKIALVSDALIFGAADYSAKFGILPSLENLIYPRNVISVAATSARIPAIDTACFDLSQIDTLIAECKFVKQIGFSGKAAIHPFHIETINQYLAPSQDDVLWAKNVINKLDSSFDSVSSMDGNMIGPPFISIANKILNKCKEEQLR